MRAHYPWFGVLVALLWLVGCPAGDDDDSTVGDDDTTGIPADDDSAGDDDTTEAYGEFQPWAAPLADYIEALTAEYGEDGFYSAVWDLSVYLDRLYFGYGDADINSGRIFPTELRYFDDPDDPDGWVSDFAVDEEMVEQYRQFEGDDGLYIAGLDATEDDLMGNAYNRGPDNDWIKSRTLEHALHVHDIALFDGAIFAVGSGCTWEEYDAFQISSMFWRSDDGGETFDVVEKLQHPNTGDARWTRLLPLGDELYLFGFRTDGTYINDFIPYRFDGEQLEVFSEMERMWVLESHAVGPGLGLVTAVYIPAAGDFTYEAYLLAEGGEVEQLEELGDVTVLDVSPDGEGGWLLLVREGSLYGESSEQHQVLWTSGFEVFEERVAYAGETPPTSLTAWNGALYLGLDDGSIWRSARN